MILFAAALTQHHKLSNLEGARNINVRELREDVSVKPESTKVCMIKFLKRSSELLWVKFNLLHVSGLQWVGVRICRAGFEFRGNLPFWDKQTMLTKSLGVSKQRTDCNIACNLAIITYRKIEANLRRRSPPWKSLKSLVANEMPYNIMHSKHNQTVESFRIV